MSHYLSGSLMLLLLAAVTVLGMEAFGVLNAARIVDAALLNAQLELARSGGVTRRVEQLVRDQVLADGGDPSRLTISGSRPYTPYGELVSLKVVYQHPYRLTTLSLTGQVSEAGLFRIERQAVTTSGWQP